MAITSSLDRFPRTQVLYMFSTFVCNSQAKRMKRRTAEKNEWDSSFREKESSADYFRRVSLLFLYTKILKNLHKSSN